MAVQDISNNVLALDFFLPWENSGTTPTKNMIQHANWCVLYDALPKGYWFPDLGKGENTPLVLGPKAQVNSSSLIVDIAHVRAVQAHQMHLFLWGWATYDDIFPATDPHRTEFCYEVTDISGTLTVNNPYRVTLTLCDEHNCADAECVKQHASYNYSLKDPCAFK